MSDYQRGREDERRKRLPDDLRESDRYREGLVDPASLAAC